MEISYLPKRLSVRRNLFLKASPISRVHKIRKAEKNSENLVEQSEDSKKENYLPEIRQVCPLFNKENHARLSDSHADSEAGIRPEKAQDVRRGNCFSSAEIINFNRLSPKKSQNKKPQPAPKAAAQNPACEQPFASFTPKRSRTRGIIISYSLPACSPRKIIIT